MMLLNCGVGEILENPLDCKEIQSILKEISPEYSLEDAKAEGPILKPPDEKNRLIRKDPDAGKD